MLEDIFPRYRNLASLIEDIINDCLGLPPNFLKDYNDSRTYDHLLSLHYLPSFWFWKLGESWTWGWEYIDLCVTGWCWRFRSTPKWWMDHPSTSSSRHISSQYWWYAPGTYFTFQIYKPYKFKLLSYSQITCFRNIPSLHLSASCNNIWSCNSYAWARYLHVIYI